MLFATYPVYIRLVEFLLWSLLSSRIKFVFLLLLLFITLEVEVHKLLQVDESVIHARKLLQDLDNYATVEVAENTCEELLLLLKVTWLLFAARGSARCGGRARLASTIFIIAFLFLLFVLQNDAIVVEIIVLRLVRISAEIECFEIHTVNHIELLIY